MSAAAGDADTHLKDSCSYSVETAKQFLTFGAGGLAFVAALALAPDGSISSLHYWCFGVFTASVGLGLLYIMSVVGHINQHQNYDVYTTRLRCLSGLQILAVLGGVVLLGVLVFHTIRTRHVPPISGATLEVSAAGRSIRYGVPQGAVVAVKVSQAGEFDLRIEASRKTSGP